MAGAKFAIDHIDHLVGVLACLCCAAVASGQEVGAGVSAYDSLSRLIEGNKRYVRDKETHPDESLSRERN